MSSRELVLWLDERWYSALNRHLKDETVEEHLENVLDELCNQLPEREYKRISHEIWQEAQEHKREQEAARTWSAYRVVENGEEWHFILVLDKKLKKLFIAPKVRQELMRRRSAQSVMRVCGAHGFQIKFFNLK